MAYIAGQGQATMKNPWLKKNPWLSMWLSGANAVGGSVRSQAGAQAKRQSTAMMKQANKQIVDFWSGTLISPPRTKKKKSR
jgi:hypothetical protein